jgi:hypothetical protein
MYFSDLHEEAAGYWHGGTGRLVERLRIQPDEWARFVKLQNGGKPAACLGDSSHDLTYLIAAAAVFDSDAKTMTEDHDNQKEFPQ